MEEQFLKRAVIEVGFGCNNYCIFCLQEKRTPRFFPAKKVLEKIAKAREHGADWLVLTGGEPTIHPNIIDFVRFAKMIGYKRIQVISNGRMFSIEKFTKEMAEAGLTEATISFHGPNAEIHDSLTRVPGSFEQAKKGAHNCIKYGIKVSFNTALNSVNVKYLEDIVRMIREEFKIDGIDYDVVGTAPTGGVWKHKWLFPKHEEVKENLRKAIEFAEKNKIIFWVIRTPIQDMPSGYEFHKDPWESHGLDTTRMWDLVWRDEKCPPPKCEYCEIEPFCFYLKNLRKRIREKKLDYLTGYGDEIKEVDWSQKFLLKKLEDVEVVEDAGFKSFFRVEFDGITSSWDEALKKIDAARDTGVKYEMIFYVNRKSASLIDEARKIKNVVFSPMNPYKFVKYEIKDTMKFVDTTGAIMKLEEIKDLGLKPLKNFPLCMGGDMKREYWIDMHSIGPGGEIIPRSLVMDILPDVRVYAWRCWNCPLRDICPGFFGDYVKLFSFPELKSEKIPDLHKF